MTEMEPWARNSGLGEGSLHIIRKLLSRWNRGIAEGRFCREQPIAAAKKLIWQYRRDNLEGTSGMVYDDIMRQPVFLQTLLSAMEAHNRDVIFAYRAGKRSRDLVSVLLSCWVNRSKKDFFPVDDPKAIVGQLLDMARQKACEADDNLRLELLDFYLIQEDLFEAVKAEIDYKADNGNLLEFKRRRQS